MDWRAVEAVGPTVSPSASLLAVEHSGLVALLPGWASVVEFAPETGRGEGNHNLKSGTGRRVLGTPG